MNFFLTLDIGNTRIKWIVWDKGGSIIDQGIATSPDSTEQPISWQSCREAYISNVAEEKVYTSLVNNLEQSGISVHRFPVTENFVWKEEKLWCDYASSLGADRWLSAIAVWGFHCIKKPCLIISLGTAVTIDCLYSNHFLGGVILPGRRLMYQSLLENTANIKSHHIRENDDIFLDGKFPIQTDHAVDIGVRFSILGAVSLLQKQLQAHTNEEVECIVTGGDAVWLLSLIPCSSRPNLVLEGLFCYALSI